MIIMCTYCITADNQGHFQAVSWSGTNSETCLWLEFAAHFSVSLGRQDGLRIRWSRLKEVERHGSGASVSSQHVCNVRSLSSWVLQWFLVS